MHCLILDGSRKGEDLLHPARAILESELREGGASVETVELHALEIAPCKGCFGCWVATPGLCATDDAGRDVARRMIRCDLLVLLTPVTFGGYSSELKKALDRSICLLLPFFTTEKGETRHPMRYGKLPRILALGVLPSADAESEEIFRALTARNALNLHGMSMTSRVVAQDRPGELRASLTEAARRVLE